MASGLNKQAINLWGRIESRIGDILPRQAVVVEESPNGGALVRFATEDVAAESTWYPSTVAGCPIGTTGWVIVIGGGKGLFVATGIPAPVTGSSSVTSTVTPNAAAGGGATGDWEVGSGVTISGLVPGERGFMISVTFIASPTAANNGRYGFVRTSNGASTFVAPSAIAPASGTTDYVTFTYNGKLTIGSDGELKVVPAMRWSSGTMRVTAAYTSVLLV
jgi:hypothetical protein